MLPAFEDFFFAKRRSKFIILTFTHNIEQASRIQNFLFLSVRSAVRPWLRDQTCTLASAFENTVNEADASVGLPNPLSSAGVPFKFASFPLTRTTMCLIVIRPKLYYNEASCMPCNRTGEMVCDRRPCVVDKRRVALARWKLSAS